MINDVVWKCLSCGKTFDEPRKHPGHGSIPHDWDSPDEYTCPYCDSDDIVFADWCAECENVFPTEELHYGFCEDCIDKLADEYGRDYIMSSREIWDDFAWYMHKRRHERRV